MLERGWGQKIPRNLQKNQHCCLVPTVLEKFRLLSELGENMLLLFEVTLCYFVIAALLLLLLLSRFSCVRLCATPKTAAHQAPPFLGFSRQEHWSGLPFSSPMDESEK